MITLQAKLIFLNQEDEQTVLNLMRRWSSCMRYVYQRLLEGYDRKELKRTFPEFFGLNSRYVDDAILKAQSTIKSMKEIGINSEKIIFGSRKLFRQLQKRHLNGKDYQKLKTVWREKRKYNLYSRGDKSKKGNLNLRVIEKDEEVYLRINVGERKYVYAKLSYGFNNHKFVESMPLLLSGEIPYSVELKRRNNRFYVFITIEEKFPEITITRNNGVIGIDLNAYPSHIAWVETNKSGSLLSYGKFQMPELFTGRKNKREYYSWIYAREIVEMAKEKEKAIVIENVRIKDRGRRGDYAGRKSRRIRHNFVYRKLLERIKICALREGIQVIEVNPAYTSVIDMLKYAPQFMISKDIASAYVIARRGLGKKEKIPKHYKEIIKSFDKERFEQLRKELAKAIKSKCIRARYMKEVDFLIKSLESEPERLSRPLDGTSLGSHYLWRVLKVAVVTPLSPERVLRDLSILKRTLIQGKWRDPRGGEFLLLGAGAMGAQIPPAGAGHPELAVKNTPAPELYGFV